MSELTELERREEQRKINEISGTPRHIEINEKSLEAYRKSFADKKLVIESKHYPRQDFYLVKKQKKFDSIVDVSKGIQKKIIAMVRQPVTITENGKSVTKDALYYYGQYRGVDHMENEIAAEFHEGWYLKPKLRFIASNTGVTKKDYDETTGERKGDYDIAGKTFEHYIFLPDNKAERVKFLQDIMKNSPGTSPESVAYGGHLSYRQSNLDNSHTTSHGGNFNWQQFGELSLKELGEVQQKGYYHEEKTGNLKDREGVRLDWNRSTGKLEAIK